MNNTQRAKLDASNRVSAFNKKYEPALKAIVEYALEKQNFDDAMAVINSAAQSQAAQSGTQLDAVETAKIKMANITIKYAMRAMVKAKQAGDLALASMLNQSVSYISKTTKTQSVYRAKEIRDNLKNNLATLTNLVAANIVEIDTAINHYNNIKDNPIIARQSKAANGTNPLPTAFEIINQATDNMYHLVVSYYLDTNRPMVDELALAKQIITTGVHHNGLAGQSTKGSITSDEL